MASISVYLRGVPADPNADDVRLYDPTQPDAPISNADVIGAVFDIDEWFPEDDDESSVFGVTEDAPVTTFDVWSQHATDESDEEDDDGWQATSIFDAPLTLPSDILAIIQDVDDDDDDSDVWQSQVTPALNNYVPSMFDVDDDIVEEADEIFAQIIESVAVATDFITAVCQVDDDFQDDDEPPAVSGFYDDAPVTPPPTEQPAAQAFTWNSGRKPSAAPEEKLDDDEDLLFIIALLAKERVI